MLGLNALVLSKLTSSMQVQHGENRVNLGLNLKFEAKKQKVLGYSRKIDRGWEYSEKAIQLIQQYMIRFPAFIAGIQQNSQGNIYEATDIFPASEAKAKVQEIQAWLKEVESKSFEKVPLDAEQLDSDIVSKIEQASNEAFKLDPPGKGVNKKINGAPRNALLKPADAEQRLSHQRFRLGDRVVYVQDSGRVPIATRGTVVGKLRTSRTTLLDVLFDVTFMSGTSLQDRCSPFRGSTVPIHSVLNLSDPQLIVGSRASQSSRQQSQQQSPLQANYGAPLGPNGRGQLVPAQVPGPLRGSFRGALNGQAGGTRGSASPMGRRGLGYRNGPGEQQQLPLRNQASNHRGRGFGGQPTQFTGASARGRGSFNSQQPMRNGYTKIDAGDTEGIVENHSFQPKSYNNAAPPPTLDTRGRGRGTPRGRMPSRGIAPRSRGTRSTASAVVVPEA